ncbi:oxidoreductase [Pseudomonadales bacterium]|nr:oxidoreductase [Pseudomonadales bacterium]
MSNKKDSQLSGKTIVLIGAAGLLGQRFVQHVFEAGANVVVADYNEQAAELVCNALIKNERNRESLMSAHVNIVDESSIRRLLLSAKERFHGVDSVVNTAYPRNANYGRKFEDVTYADFCENVDLNLGGYFLVAQIFAKYFAENGGGDIINIASIYGVIAPKFEIYENTNMTTPVEYAVIKSALIHLGKYISKYYRGKRVRVNTISPGGISDGQPEEFIKQYNERCNSVGMLSPVEIANVLIFLLSEASKGISGQNIVVDDGFVL